MNSARKLVKFDKGGKNFPPKKRDTKEERNVAKIKLFLFRKVGGLNEKSPNRALKINQFYFNK